MSAGEEREGLRVTLAIGRGLAELVARLRGRLGDDAAARERSARLAMACAFALIAEDLGLGEPWFRAALAGGWRADEVRAGWRRTAGISPLARHLFADTEMDLEAGELQALREVAAWDASRVEASIFGGLLERSLEADERARLGAHFTPRAYIERIVEPTMMAPLRRAWAAVRAEIAECDDIGRARARCGQFLDRLAAVRVLDPACGTGNFLYVAMDLLRGLEREVVGVSRGLGGAAGMRVQPGQFLGIERKEGSRRIAELVLWVGYMQGWRVGDPPRELAPSTAEIVVGDALLADDGAARVWPAVDYVVSNPPFIGNKRMRELLGDAYAEAVRAVYGAGPDGLPGDVEYVAYWWHKAALRLREPGSRLARFGFITTNSVRQRQSGAVLRHHLQRGVVLQFACPDHPWIDPAEELGGAAVRISMTVARRADEAGAGGAVFVEDIGGRGELRLRETRVARINPDLTIGADLSAARPLAANAGLCFQGMNLVGEGFRVDASEVEALGGPGVVRRYVQGRDLKAGGGQGYVIDLFDMDEDTARRRAPACMQRLERSVLPQRRHNGRETYARRWWLFGEPRPGLRRALAGLPRYIATPETSTFRFFVMLAADIVPDHQIYVVASADPYVLGVLSSRVHGAWARRAGGRNGAGNDSRWNSRSTFLPFPFPDASAGQRREIGGWAERLLRAREQLLAASPGLSLTGLYHRVEALRGEPAVWREDPRSRVDRGACEAIVELHAALDRAVLAAYGYPLEIATEALLVRLLALNLARATTPTCG